jgi:predicted ATP-dependent endonuclease of OLD family
MTPSHISIKKLHGYKDLEIPFDDPYIILLAENGQGKTSVLNLIYGALCNDPTRISSINFEKMSVHFPDGEEFHIASEDMATRTTNLNGNGTRYLRNKLSEKEFDEVMLQIKSGKNPLDIHRDFKLRHRTLASAAFRDAAEELSGQEIEFSSGLSEMLNEINSRFGCTPLYLPTYRRIEEDFMRLGLDEQPTQTRGINFGVKDVENKLEEMRKAILTSSNESFSRVNGEILAKLINGFELTQDDIDQVRSLDRLDLVLERIGGHMKAEEKEQIDHLFHTGQIFAENKYEPLIYFLSNMVKVYRQQKKYDLALRDFTDKCNGYLVAQKLVYDENAVTVKALNKFTERPVDLKDMSSGEKQVVSLFAKLYLDSVAADSDENLAIFFDEPELSLSVEWQEKLLPDIIASKKCRFLFSVTHSPFILKA